MNTAPEKKIDLYYSMLRIRRVQERVESLYLEDEMRTPVHLYIGQEAVAAGVCGALSEKDYITSNHRGHGHYLAKGGDLKGLIAELHCRETGCSGGYGGSMHLVDTSIGHMGSSSIVGGGIPIGTGLGLAIQMKKEARVSAVFFGDGAADEGVLYESVNFAMLKRLPVLYILENNKWSVCSHVSARQAGKNIFHSASPDLLYTDEINGNDVLAVYETARRAADRARKGNGPSFIECDTYRILGHAGCAAQEPGGYRDPGEVERWKGDCPVCGFRESLLAEGIITEDDLENMEDRIGREIDDAFAFARESPLPGADGLKKTLFSD